MVIHSRNRKNRYYIPISRISSNYPKSGSWTGWSERFLRYRARRNDAEWSFHSKELQRSAVPQKLFNPPRSELTKKVKLMGYEKSFSTIAFGLQMSGQLPDLGSNQSALSKRHGRARANDKMIENLHVYQSKCLF
jgi:hypothetical protein